MKQRALAFCNKHCLPKTQVDYTDVATIAEYMNIKGKSVTPQQVTQLLQKNIVKIRPILDHVISEFAREYNFKPIYKDSKLIGYGKVETTHEEKIEKEKFGQEDQRGS